MTRSFPAVLLLVSAVVFAAGFPISTFAGDPEPDDYRVLREIIILEFAEETPHEFGAVVPGVKTRMKTAEKVVAVTLDAGGLGGNGIDKEILRVLEEEKIPITLFASGEWLDQNTEKVKRLSANPQFEIANLGLEAKACLVAGKTPGGVPSTKSAEEVFAEIEKNARKIEAMTGVLPRFFRAGAAYYDDVAVRIARALGYEVVGTGIRVRRLPGAAEPGIVESMLSASAGSIATVPLSGSGAGTAQGLKQTISKLRVKGFQFVKLGDYPLE